MSTRIFPRKFYTCLRKCENENGKITTWFSHEQIWWPPPILINGRMVHILSKNDWLVDFLMCIILGNHFLILICKTMWRDVIENLNINLPYFQVLKDEGLCCVLFLLLVFPFVINTVTYPLLNFQKYIVILVFTFLMSLSSIISQINSETMVEYKYSKGRGGGGSSSVYISRAAW